MSKASVQTSANSAETGVTTGAPSSIPPMAGRAVRKGPLPRALILRALKLLASLKLTVVLLAMSAVLVFLGTLAQVHLGIWTVVHTYFRSFYVWIPLEVFFTPTHHANRWLGFPYPGGWLLGTLLLANLLAAHIVRFKFSWKRTGILLIHAGLIILMLGELVTGLFAVEGQMQIEIGRATNFVTHTERKELAFVIPNAEAGKDDVVVVPESLLRQRGWITNPDLPCDVKVEKYMVNSDVQPNPPPPKAPIQATAGAGLEWTPKEEPEGAGVDSDAKMDSASAYVTLRKKGSDQILGVYLVSQWFTLDRMSRALDQPVEIGGKKYLLSLRGEREYPGYTVQLLEIHPHRLGRDGHPQGILQQDPPDRPDPERGARGVDSDERAAPLPRSDVLSGRDASRDSGTVLEVVSNPGFAMPYLACTMVIIGMLVHFGMSLVGFLRKRALS